MRAIGWVLLLLAGFAGIDAGLASDRVPPFPEGEAFRHLEAQCAFGPRVPGTRAHQDCLAYLERTLKAAGGVVALERFRAKTDASSDTLTLTNVVARFGPPGGGILLGAHWDSRPFADQDPDSANHLRPILGANDGASGVAVLLTLAGLLGRQPPPVPVQIVLFDAEDQAREGNTDGYLLGSREHVRRLAPPYPQAVVVIDIVGGKDLHICREEHSEQNAGWLNQILFERARLLGLPGFEDRVCYAVYDDHVPFLQRGIPAVDLIDMHFPEWHTVRDVPAVCSEAALGQCGRLLADLVYGGSLR